MAGLHRIYVGGELEVLQEMDEASVTLIYIRPPTLLAKLWGESISEKQRNDIAAELDGYVDFYNAYLAYLEPRLRQAHRILSPDGTLYFHTDYDKAHYCKALLLDLVFGHDNFLNEVIWAYPGAQTSQIKNRWPVSHDTVLVYAKELGQQIFNLDEIDRLPYLAPGLVNPEKQERGKLPTDAWLDIPSLDGVLRRMIRASSKRGDAVLDIFDEDQLTGEVCLEEGRKFLLIERSASAAKALRQKLARKVSSEQIEIVNPKSGKSD